MKTKKNQSVGIAVLGLFSAVIVVLQLLSYVVKIGVFNLSLVLIPIVLGAVLYGPKKGAILGVVFGVVTALASAFGLDLGGNILFTASPILTVLVCIVKGAAAGFAAGVVANALKNKNIYLAVICAALITPVVNTGIFVAAMFLFFRSTLEVWANGQDLVFYTITGLLGVNFLIEFGLNLILSPVVLRTSKALLRLVRS